MPAFSPHTLFCAPVGAFTFCAHTRQGGRDIRLRACRPQCGNVSPSGLSHMQPMHAIRKHQKFQKAIIKTIWYRLPYCFCCCPCDAIAAIPNKPPCRINPFHHKAASLLAKLTLCFLDQDCRAYSECRILENSASFHHVSAEIPVWRSVDHIRSKNRENPIALWLFLFFQVSGSLNTPWCITAPRS